MKGKASMAVRSGHDSTLNRYQSSKEQNACNRAAPCQPMERVLPTTVFLQENAMEMELAQGVVQNPQRPDKEGQGKQRHKHPQGY